jgi:hypothetical protein
MLAIIIKALGRFLAKVTLGQERFKALFAADDIIARFEMLFRHLVTADRTSGQSRLVGTALTTEAMAFYLIIIAFYIATALVAIDRPGKKRHEEKKDKKSEFHKSLTIE